MSDAMSAAGMICNELAWQDFSRQMERRRERDAVIDDLINRHNALAATNAALVADHNALQDHFQKLARDHEWQERRIAQLERQLAREREQARITIRDLKSQVENMRPVFDKYNMHYLLGLP
ncbi:MAG TPA: hypothetical protein VKI44_31760 [Acetobacteraceae bacterium]|nr:hypothetical protein [Acetobacteraceae bacterium]